LGTLIHDFMLVSESGRGGLLWMETPIENALRGKTVFKTELADAERTDFDIIRRGGEGPNKMKG